MHSKSYVKDVIDEIKFALIPIVPYSPSLNGVVEGYFGFVKIHNFLKRYLTDDQSIKLNIIKNWKDISNNKYKTDLSIIFFKEWLYGLQACKRGEPIYSEHCFPEKVDFDYGKLCNITVNRIFE